MRKKLLALALTLALVVSLCPTTLAASTLKASEATTEVERRLAEIQTQKGFKPGDTSTNCFTFAQSVFEKIFGYKTNTLFYCGKLKSNGANLVRVGRLFVPRDGCSCDDPSLETDPTPISADTVKTLLSQAKCGDIIQTLRFNSKHEGCAISQPHTLLVQSVGQDSIVTYEGNISGCVVVRSHTYAEMAKSYTHAITLYRANNYDKVNGSSSNTATDNAPATSSLTISPTTFPSQNMPKGQPFYFKGKITSNYKITSASIGIFTPDGKGNFQSKTIYPNTTTVDIATSGLDALKFGELPDGVYKFYLRVSDASGTTKEWEHPFSIGAGVSSTLSIGDHSKVFPDGLTLDYGADYQLSTSITSNYSIKSIIATLYQSDVQTVVEQKKLTPNAKTVDAGSYVVNALSFERLTAGKYFFSIIAEDESGTKRSWGNFFTVKYSPIQALSTSSPTPQDTAYTLTINYYIDNKLVFTDRSPGGNGDVCHIYKMPDAYHNYSFWSSSATSSIGLFGTELWIPGLSENSTIDLYANSDGSAPSQFLNSYEVVVVSVDEDGAILGRTSISTVEGDKCYYRPMDYTGYEFARCDGDYSDCTFDSALGLIKIPAVYQDGTVMLVYRKTQSSPEPSTAPAPSTAPEPSATPAATSSGSLSNFRSVSTYYSGTFYDVSVADWFNENVKRAYELGLMKGMSENSFGPNSSVTVAQAITLAARLHSIYYTGSENFVQSGSNWYDVYVTYARNNGIHYTTYDYSGPISRGDFAYILAKALPAEALPAIDSDIYFDDVKSTTSYQKYIYLLAQAGIIRGVPNIFGTLDFQPDYSITRAQVAAIVTRMADPSLRQ